MVNASEVSDIHRNWDKIFEKQDSDMFRRAHSRFIPTEQQIVKLFNCNLTVNDITLKTNLNVNDNETDQSDSTNKSVDHTTTTPTNNEFLQIDSNQNCATNSDKMRRQTDTKHISYSSRALNKNVNKSNKKVQIKSDNINSTETGAYIICECS
jgi:hypothetical protein